MKPVMQEIVHPERGDCWSACLASLLELKIEEVPKFVWHFKGYELEATNLWLAPRGYTLLRTHLKLPNAQGWSEIPFHPLRYTECIATGQSPNFPGVFHCVCGFVKDYDFVMTHDPSPKQKGIIGMPVSYNFLVPRYPADMKLKESAPWVDLSKWC